MRYGRIRDFESPMPPQAATLPLATGGSPHISTLARTTTSHIPKVLVQAHLYSPSNALVVSEFKPRRVIQLEPLLDLTNSATGSLLLPHCLPCLTSLLMTLCACARSASWVAEQSVCSPLSDQGSRAFHRTSYSSRPSPPLLCQQGNLRLSYNS